MYIADANIAKFHFCSFTLFYSWTAFVGKYFQDYFICFEMQVSVFQNFFNSIVENPNFSNRFNEKIRKF